MKSMQGFSQQKGTVIVESVVPLTSEQTATLISSLKLSPDSIVIDNRQNPSLIAGIRVMYSGKIIDLSFQSLLNQLDSDKHE